MVTTDWDRFREHKGTGMLKDVFSDADTMEKMQGMSD
jgi:glutamine phosphoribosylpyrophosphate amidotransferase